jgi:hypothetical protein
MWQQRTDEFIRVMAKLVDDTITSGSINLQVDKEENQKE